MTLRLGVRHPAVLLESSLLNAFVPFHLEGRDLFIFLVQPCTRPFRLMTSHLRSFPYVTVYDVWQGKDDLIGFIFDPANQIVTQASNHLLIRVAGLRNYSADDLMECGTVTKLLSVDPFSVFHLDLGAILFAHKPDLLIQRINNAK